MQFILIQGNTPLRATLSNDDARARCSFRIARKIVDRKFLTNYVNVWRSNGNPPSQKFFHLPNPSHRAVAESPFPWFISRSIKISHRGSGAHECVHMRGISGDTMARGAKANIVPRLRQIWDCRQFVGFRAPSRSGEAGKENRKKLTAGGRREAKTEVEEKGWDTKNGASRGVAGGGR